MKQIFRCPTCSAAWDDFGDAIWCCEFIIKSEYICEVCKRIQDTDDSCEICATVEKEKAKITPMPIIKGLTR